MTHEESEVIRAACELAEAGKRAGFGSVESAYLHNVYDAVRKYAESLKRPPDFGLPGSIPPILEQSRYEYIRLRLDAGDLSELNRFSGAGWHVIAVFQDTERFLDEKTNQLCALLRNYVLLERKVR